MKKIKGNIFFKILIICGALLFAVIAYVVIKSTSTVTAIVPNQTIKTGIKIEDSMIKSVQIPSNTPKGFVTDKSTLIGQKLKISANENQLLYTNNLMSSWDDFSKGESIPSDYIVTSIQLPSNRAVGGLITAGDTVDILGVPNSTLNTTTKETLNNYLGNISKDSYGANGSNIYWILSNVKILETDSTLSTNSEASISTVTKDKNTSSNGSYYIVALSYDDYKKLRLSELYLDLWMNISPVQNGEHGPLLDKMKDNIIKELQDAQTQSQIKEDKNKKDKKETEVNKKKGE